MECERGGDCGVVGLWDGGIVGLWKYGVRDIGGVLVAMVSDVRGFSFEEDTASWNLSLRDRHGSVSLSRSYRCLSISS